MKQERLMELAGIVSEAKYTDGGSVIVKCGEGVYRLTPKQVKKVEKLSNQLREAYGTGDDNSIETLSDAINDEITSGQSLKIDYVYDWDSWAFVPFGEWE